jgi:hypothetical protein
MAWIAGPWHGLARHERALYGESFPFRELSDLGSCPSFDHKHAEKGLWVHAHGCAPSIATRTSSSSARSVCGSSRAAQSMASLPQRPT